MRWKTKSHIMRLCSGTAIGRSVYRLLQNLNGRIKANPATRLPLFNQMARWLQSENVSIRDTTVFEVGTGHLPVVPICFFLCGAKKIITCDLNKRLDKKMTAQALHWFVENQDTIRNDFLELTDKQTFDERMALLEKHKADVDTFLEYSNIEYRAPADAASTSLPDESVDIHVSVTVLEHIPDNVINRIWVEASRILKKDGIAVHLVDLSDHFQHQDKTISRINFLQFSPEEWESIAGNEYAYCNRLRPNDYLKTARDAGAYLLKSEVTVDKYSLSELDSGFRVHESFKHLPKEEVCARKFNFMMKFSNSSEERSHSSTPKYIFD